MWPKMPTRFFGQKQREAQHEFGAAINKKFNDKAAQREARDAKVQALKQAQHDVTYFSEYLERETLRAKAVVQYAGVSIEDASQIVAAAEDKLEEAQERLRNCSLHG